MSANFDAIIVGAGSAGCVIANRLSEDPARRVLLIEAGGWDGKFWSRMPIGYYRMINDRRYSRSFMTEPSDGTAGRAINWPRGRVIGGSSSINGLIFIRGQHDDFDDWERQGAAGWSFRDVLPYFRKLESYSGGDDQLRGRLGPIKVDNLRNENAANDAWFEAARAWGLKDNSDFNGATTEGVGRYQLTLDGHWRSSAATGYLHPIKNRKNLTILTDTLVERIIFEGDRAVGVSVRGKEGPETYRAEDVVLCAGALQTPQLLQLSGIGPADHLRDLDIEVVQDAKGVGANLQDHMQMRTIVSMTERLSLNDEVRNPVSLARMGLQWLFNQSGPLTVGGGQIGGALATKYATDGRPDIQLFAMPLSVDKPGEPLHDYSGFTTAVWQCHPRSRGTVRIRSAEPAAAPEVRPNYLSDEHDRKVMVEGVKIVREIHAQQPFKRLWDREVIAGKDVRTDAEILDAVRQHAATVYHACGTCRMGTDEMSVVDPSSLKVNGVQNLFVVDASIMPNITSANTNAAAIMIGEKGADLLLDQL